MQFVNALALVGKADSHLAVAGRFNQLTLWDLKTDKLRQITGNGSNKDYILSMSSTDSKPNMLVTGDNQGKIKVWNLRPCLEGKDECELVSEWNGDGQAVRAVALSDDGCYLASAGEDGQAKLWTLDNLCDRTGQNLAGQVVMRSQKAPSLVAIFTIFIISLTWYWCDCLLNLVGIIPHSTCIKEKGYISNSNTHAATTR